MDAVVADIRAAGGTAVGVPCDIANASEIKTAVEKVVATYGGIDILVNNAFDSSAPFSSILDRSTEQLQRNFEMGPIAYLRTMQAAHPHLKASGEGRIINFGSMAGVSKRLTTTVVDDGENRHQSGAHHFRFDGHHCDRVGSEAG